MTTGWLLVQAAAALASALAAVLLWLAWLRQGRAAQAGAERLRAKDEQIAALVREAEALRDLAPLKIREYFLQTHAQLKRYGRLVEAAYRGARKEIERCNGEITRLQERGEWRADDIDRLVQRRETLLEITRGMQPGLSEVQHQCEFPEPFTVRVARLVPEAIQGLTQAHQALARQLTLEDAGDMPDLSHRVEQSCRYRLDDSTLFSSTLFTRPGDAAEVWQRPDNGE